MLMTLSLVIFEVLELICLLDEGDLEVSWHHFEKTTCFHLVGQYLFEISFKSKNFRFTPPDQFDNFVVLREFLRAHYGHQQMQSLYWCRGRVALREAAPCFTSREVEVVHD